MCPAVHTAQGFRWQQAFILSYHNGEAFVRQRAQPAPPTRAVIGGAFDGGHEAAQLDWQTTSGFLLTLSHQSVWSHTCAQQDDWSHSQVSIRYSASYWNHCKHAQFPTQVTSEHRWWCCELFCTLKAPGCSSQQVLAHNHTTDHQRLQFKNAPFLQAHF